MASDHTQPNQVNPDQSQSLPLPMNDDDLTEHRGESSRDYGSLSGGDEIDRKNHDAVNIKSLQSRMPNDTKIIRDRKIYSDRKLKRKVELVCEDKASKYKLEEAHNSRLSLSKPTFLMTFSPDGQRVASTHGDHRIYICDVSSGKLLETLEGHPKTPWCLAWHPGNKEILASGCLAGVVKVWDLKSKACETWTSVNNTIINNLDFHPKERILAIATSNDILFWDWSESEPFTRTTTANEKAKIKYVVFDATGTKLITGIANVPKMVSYGNDSLQHRIIDGYLSPRSVENMTQNSEITSNPTNISTNNLTSGDSNQHDPNSSPSGRQVSTHHGVQNRNVNVGGNSILNEEEITDSDTSTLTRIASLYRQLDALEDSMRHTSFAPIVDSSTEAQFVECLNINDNRANNQSSREEFQITTTTSSDNNGRNRKARLADEQQVRNSQPDAIESSSTVVTTGGMPGPSDQTSRSVHLDSLSLAPTNFEPYLVTFDGSLELLQLPPLIVDGNTVNLANVIEQYPLDISNRSYYSMQFDSINRVNQNFIRISKLMSSARLYRQIVHQIRSSNSEGTSHHPNQILTVQSVSSRSQRNSPIVLHTGNSNPPSGIHRDGLADPIRAIQFRQSARNVPLATICKIDLLAARALCIMRSQLLVENTLTNDRLISLTGPQPPVPATSSSAGNDDTNSTSYHSVLAMLHKILMQINHATLTTSNAYTHIVSLRTTLELLLRTMAAVLHSSAESSDLISLIHNIAFSLTGRSWKVPLGATLNEVRLDVIHTLCIVDLTLHFARQVQLLQMQRITLVARIEESRRSGDLTLRTDSKMQAHSSTNAITEPSISSNETSSGLQPSTSSGFSNGGKRKVSAVTSEAKRRRVEECNQMRADLASPMRADGAIAAEEIIRMQIMADEYADLEAIRANDIGPGIVSDLNDPLDGASSNTINGRQTDQSIFNHVDRVEAAHRFLVTNPQNIHNSHQILVRIYQRVGGRPSTNQATISMLNQPIERPSLANHESRRRALSQDNSSEIQDVTMPPAESNDSEATETIRARIRAPIVNPVNFVDPRHPDHVPYGMVNEHLRRHVLPHLYRAASQYHLWFNQWPVPNLSIQFSNFRLQCWNFSLSRIPDIQDSECNVIASKCRIYNDYSVDISNDGNLIACLVPHDDDGPSCSTKYHLKIISSKSFDFGTCYYSLPLNSNAFAVSLSPSGKYAIIGETNPKPGHQMLDEEDELTIGKVFKLDRGSSYEFVRHVTIKRGRPYALNLNAIKWMDRGIIYNVGLNHNLRPPRG